MEIFVRKTFQGAYALSALVNSYRVEQQYMGYTLREAKKLFRKFIKENKE
jgi:hypothetical protein